MFVAGSVLGALALGKEAVVAVISFLLVLANIFVVKQITLFGFQVTASDVYVIGAVLGFNLLQEFFGKEIAKRTIFIGFFVSILLALFARMHVMLSPNEYDVTQKSFSLILGFLPRIILGSLMAHLGAQFLRLWLYSFFKKMFKNRLLVTRNILVMTIEQAADTMIFGFVGLYGVVHALTDVFVMSFAVKVITIFCSSPAVFLAKHLFLKVSPPTSDGIRTRDSIFKDKQC